MANEIYITAYEDSLSLDGSVISAVSDSKEYLFDLEDVLKIVILTTDAGPFDEDMWLKVYAGGDVIFIPSGHRCYESFLFDQIGKVLPIDHKNIIEASACTTDKEFVLYEREDSEKYRAPAEEGNRKNGINIFKDKDGVKISGSIDLGYIGTFKDSQIELDNTLEDIDLAKLKTASGCGIRIKVRNSPRTNFRLDYAQSNESNGFYFTLMEAF